MAQEQQVTISVRVTPSASKDEVTGFRDGVLYLRVTAPPRDGRANDAVVALLTKTLDVAKRDLHIVRGHSSRQKLITVHGLTIQDLEALLGPQHLL